MPRLCPLGSDWLQFGGDADFLGLQVHALGADPTRVTSPAPEVLSPVQEEGEWVRRPLLGLALTGTSVLLPVAAAVATAAVVSRRLPTVSGGPQIALWWLAVFGASTSVLIAVEHVTRRLSPMAGLLKMSLVFPGLPPSRVELARRVASTRNLARDVQEARDHGIGGER